MASDDSREYEDFDRLSGAEDRGDGADDAFAQFSDEIMDSTGIGDDDPAAVKESREHRDA
jgi:hypothetical protein